MKLAISEVDRQSRAKRVATLFLSGQTLDLPSALALEKRVELAIHRMIIDETQPSEQRAVELAKTLLVAQLRIQLFQELIAKENSKK